MTSLEERLSAALDARAHQIGDSDLQPALLPKARWHRNRLMIVLAAAACTALVIGVPYAIAQLDGDAAPQPPASTPSDTPSAPTGIGLGADWPVAQTGHLDLEGDGAQETIRLRIEPDAGSNPGGAVAARIEVELPSGTLFLVMPSRAPDFHLEGPVAIVGSDGEEPLVSVGSTLEVLDLVDGKLVLLEAPSDPPLIRRTDSQGRSVTWVVDQHGLQTVRSIQPVPSGDSPVLVQRWSWRVSGLSLVPDISRTDCAPASDLSKSANCENDPIGDVRPQTLTSVPIGQSATLDFEHDGSPVTARLVARPGFTGSWMNDGDVKLVVTAGGRTWEAQLGMGPIPKLYRQFVLPSTTGFGILVGETAFDGEGFVVFTWVNDELVALQYHGQDPDLGTTVNTVLHNQGHETRTWMQSNFLYSAFGPDGSPKKVYRWDQTGTSIGPVLLGTYCFKADNTGSPC